MRDEGVQLDLVTSSTAISLLASPFPRALKPSTGIDQEKGPLGIW